MYIIFHFLWKHLSTYVIYLFNITFHHQFCDSFSDRYFRSQISGRGFTRFHLFNLVPFYSKTSVSRDWRGPNCGNCEINDVVIIELFLLKIWKKSLKSRQIIKELERKKSLIKELERKSHYDQLWHQRYVVTHFLT